MQEGTSRSVAERLDYLKVCEAVINAYEELYKIALQNYKVCGTKNLDSERADFYKQAEEYKRLQQHYINLKVAIGVDLSKDPNFIEYSESIQSPLQISSQTVETESTEGPSFGGR